MARGQDCRRHNEAQAPSAGGAACARGRCRSEPTAAPIFSDRAAQACASPGREGYEWSLRAAVPEWRNEVTLSSFEYVRSNSPGQWIHRIAPRPLLIVVASGDALTPAEDTYEAFERASEPKRLVRVPCRHFEIYSSAHYEKASNAMLEWFTEHLA